MAIAADGSPILKLSVREFEIARMISDDLSDKEIASRVAAYESPPSPFGPGVMAKYAASVSSASEGAVTG